MPSHPHTIDLVRHSLAVERVQQQLDADPLATFRFRSWAQRELAEKISIAEVYWRSGNQGGKTLGGAALGIALAQGRATLDGVALPRLGSPNVGWVLTKTYKQQTESVQEAYLQLLGTWPHKIAYTNRALNYIGVIYVKPIGCRTNDHRRWSRIYFHCEGQGKSLPGGRIDWCHADEPPKPERWREVRARGKRNRRFVRYITATPLNLAEWKWLEVDFRLAARKVWRGRYEIQSSVEDNTALSKRHIRKLRQSYRGDPLYRARMFGAHVDATGDPAFAKQWKQLERWERLCFEPRVRMVTVLSRITTHSGREIQEVTVPVEIFRERLEGHRYVGIVDASEGIEDAMHDPAELLICDLDSDPPEVVARYNGYLSAYGMGHLAGAVGWLYNEAQIDPEMNAGWGELVLNALSDMGYGAVHLEQVVDRLNQITEQIGFRTHRFNRGNLVGAVQHLLELDAVRVNSVEVVRALMGVTVEKSGKVVAGPGRHDESLITLGRFGLLLERSQGYRRTLIPKPETFYDRVNRAFGRQVVTAPVPRGRSNGAAPPRPRPRTRR